MVEALNGKNVKNVSAIKTAVSFLLRGLIITHAFWKKTQRTNDPNKNRQENIMAEENKTTTQGSGPIPAAAQDKFENSKTHVRKAAEDLKSAAGVMAG